MFPFNLVQLIKIEPMFLTKDVKEWSSDNAYEIHLPTMPMRGQSNSLLSDAIAIKFQEH